MPRESELDVLAGVRTSIIEVLEIAASFDAQRRYQENVPFINVPTELLAMWDDLAAGDLDWAVGPVFAADELAAMRRFTAARDSVHKAMPGFFPPLAEVLLRAEWAALRSEGERALAVFMRRGKQISLS